MSTLVFLRHGQSVWNLERRFTGWLDATLSPQGRAEAESAGRLLAKVGLRFDRCFTSYLERATDTLRIVLETMDVPRVPVHESWRLNERHYGALEGLTRKEVAEQYGAEQVRAWQQDFDVLPPALDRSDRRFPGHDPRYGALTPAELPCAESLENVRARVLPYWHDTIVPHLVTGETVLVVAHGNSIRAVTTYLDGVSNADISHVKRFVTGQPFLYRFDATMTPVRCGYLSRTTRVTRWAKEFFRP